jgi:hypothetical protein
MGDTSYQIIEHHESSEGLGSNSEAAGGMWCVLLQAKKRS